MASMPTLATCPQPDVSFARRCLVFATKIVRRMAANAVNPARPIGWGMAKMLGRPARNSPST
eukprot:5174350-Lingulodinium_polyedra.AAC.1